MRISKLLFGYGYSQELPNQSPATPEVAAMGKHLDVPVSYATGVLSRLLQSKCFVKMDSQLQVTFCPFWT